MYSLNCRGRLLSWEAPIVMGIMNLTPDSFFRSSRLRSENELLLRAEKMLTEGATILDLGGMSSRPGAEDISIPEEMDRVVPAIKKIIKYFPQAFISVDSYRYKVVEAALDAGACMVNDIGAGSLEDMVQMAVKNQAPYICMHMRGNPQNMQSLTHYEDITTEVLDFFIKRKASVEQMGMQDLIIDPGFGFAKTIKQNFRLLKDMRVLGMLNCPLMVGLSRKATIYKTLGIEAEQALNGTTVMHTLALTQGANILRAHDVKEAMETIRLWASYTSA